jgi:hypothetical protein
MNTANTLKAALVLLALCVSGVASATPVEPRDEPTAVGPAADPDLLPMSGDSPGCYFDWSTYQYTPICYEPGPGDWDPMVCEKTCVSCYQYNPNTGEELWVEKCSCSGSC